MDLSHHTKSKGDLGVLKAQVDLFEPKKFRSNVSLRVKASKNGQAKRVNFAADFRRAP
jgi:hypothetical protein